MGIARQACPLCGAEDLDPLFTIANGFSLAECRRCGIAATVPAVPESEIGAFYPPAYYGERNRRFHALLERWIVRFRRRRAERIRRFVAVGRVLDVGCGRGLIPALLRRRGWEAHATEISDTAARHAREVLGLPVFVGPLTASPYPSGSFDAVILWHVLEHLAAPRAALEKARDLLRPGGLLLLAVPNFDSLQARWTGRHWFHLDVPRHYVHFRSAAVCRLISECGFSIREVSYFSLEQNPYGWIQSLLNRLGIRHNLLYDILKRSGARTVRHPVREYPLQTVAMLLALPIVVPLSALLYLVELLLRRGGTVEIYATREDRP